MKELSKQQGSPEESKRPGMRNQVPGSEKGTENQGNEKTFLSPPTKFSPLGDLSGGTHTQ